MLTRSAGVTYDHPLVSVANADTRFDYGWYSHVKVSVESEDLLISRIQLPRPSKREREHFSTTSVQANWIVQKVT